MIIRCTGLCNVRNFLWLTWLVDPPCVADAKAAASCDGVIPPDCNKRRNISVQWLQQQHSILEISLSLSLSLSLFLSLSLSLSVHILGAVFHFNISQNYMYLKFASRIPRTKYDEAISLCELKIWGIKLPDTGVYHFERNTYTWARSISYWVIFIIRHLVQVKRAWKRTPFG